SRLPWHRKKNEHNLIDNQEGVAGMLAKIWKTALLMLAATLLVKVPAVAQVAEGKPAPAFKLKTQDGKDWDLSSRKGKGWTVLYFYPKADSPGCTTQACAFRDTIKRIQERKAELVGISADDLSTQLAFHKKHQLNFDLLSDADLKVIEMY